MTYSDNNVVFFDSECVLCGNLLKLLLKIDRRQVLKFASLQSEYARSMLPAEFVSSSSYKSVAFFRNGRIYYYSTAVIKIFSTLGFPWSLMKAGYLLPKTLRDKLYMLISNNRYSWFGKSDQCIIPDQKTQDRFVHPLDL